MATYSPLIVNRHPTTDLDSGTPPLRFQRHRPRLDSVVLSAFGDVDLMTSPLLEAELALESPHTLVLDFSHVAFISVRGVTTLEEATDRAHREGRRLVLVACSASAKRTMSLCGTLSRISIVDRSTAPA
jgi:anti-anti-sigma factor